MSTHSIGFYGKIRKIMPELSFVLCLLSKDVSPVCRSGYLSMFDDN